MNWIQLNAELPPLNTPVECQLKHCGSGSICVHRLIRVEESDCNWRTAADRCEISYDWDVIAWKREK